MAFVWFFICFVLPVYGITWLVCNASRTQSSIDSEKAHWRQIESGVYGPRPSKWRMAFTKAKYHMFP